MRTTDHRPRVSAVAPHLDPTMVVEPLVAFFFAMLISWTILAI